MRIPVAETQDAASAEMQLLSNLDDETLRHASQQHGQTKGLAPLPSRSVSKLLLAFNARSQKMVVHRGVVFKKESVSPSRYRRRGSVKSMRGDLDKREENGLDSEYPWRFEGRLWFRPALVRMPTEQEIPGDVRPFGLFGWTLGGVVCLEYDMSPVGPYREYVTMGSLVTKRGTVGQWGSRLFVSNRVAEEVCQRVWNVPAEVAQINFDEESPGDTLLVEVPPSTQDTAGDIDISVLGWSRTRTSEPDSVGGPIRLPVLWTPSIKALWFPFVPFSSNAGDKELPLHRLRLSADRLNLHLCGQSPSKLLGVPLPIGLSVDGLRIEIAREDGVM